MINPDTQFMVFFTVITYICLIFGQVGDCFDFKDVRVPSLKLR